MSFTVPTQASIGAFSTEIATALTLDGEYDARIANAFYTFATEVNANATTAQAQIDVPLGSAILAAGTPTIKPTDGTLGTDDVMVHALWFEFTKATLSS
jgi:hypothetical protein